MMSTDCNDIFQAAVDTILTEFITQGSKSYAVVAQELRHHINMGMDPILAFRETGRALKERNPEAFIVWLDEMVRTLTGVQDLQGEKNRFNETA
jgi:hypothetical protein